MLRMAVALVVLLPGAVALGNGEFDGGLASWNLTGWPGNAIRTQATGSDDQKEWARETSPAFGDWGTGLRQYCYSDNPRDDFEECAAVLWQNTEASDLVVHLMVPYAHHDDGMPLWLSVSEVPAPGESCCLVRVAYTFEAWKDGTAPDPWYKVVTTRYQVLPGLWTTYCLPVQDDWRGEMPADMRLFLETFGASGGAEVWVEVVKVDDCDDVCLDGNGVKACGPGLPPPTHGRDPTWHFLPPPRPTSQMPPTVSELGDVRRVWLDQDAERGAEDKDGDGLDDRFDACPWAGDGAGGCTTLGRSTPCHDASVCAIPDVQPGRPAARGVLEPTDGLQQAQAEALIESPDNGRADVPWAMVILGGALLLLLAALRRSR